MLSAHVAQFTPELLSPVPIEPQECPLPYGLTWDDVGAGLPGFVATGPPARAWISHAKQGLHGGPTSCILSLRYPRADGSWTTQTVFVKYGPATSEAAKYRFLESCGVLTPRLLHAVTRDDSEVVVLEFLPIIGVHPSAADELLVLIARLNALEYPPSDLFQRRPGFPVALFDELLRAALIALADDPVCPVPIDPDGWFSVYKRAENDAAALPMTLNHGEMYFQQVGWSRRGLQRLVMFDLETMARLPRFTDIGNVLEALAAQTGREQRELFATYLAALQRLTGVALDEDQAWNGMQLVRALTSYQSLPWLAERTRRPDISALATTTLRTLHDDLKACQLLN